MSPLSNPPHVSATSRARSAAIRSGALAAIGTWAVVVLPALVGWLAAPEGAVGWFSAVQVGTAIWFVGHGQSIGGSGVTISLTPVALFLLFVYITTRWARRLVATERALVSPAGVGRVAKCGVVPGFVIGYVGAAAVFSLLTLGGTVTPRRRGRAGHRARPACGPRIRAAPPWRRRRAGFVRGWFRRGPAWLASAWRIGWRGAGLLLGVGLAVVVLRILVSLDEVLRIQASTAQPRRAGAIVVLAQVAAAGQRRDLGPRLPGRAGLLDRDRLRHLAGRRKRLG